MDNKQEILNQIEEVKNEFNQKIQELEKQLHKKSIKQNEEEINFKQTLFRKLQRFADENNKEEIDWGR